MIDLIGWVASALFTLCAAPQAYQCWRNGHADGISRPFIWMWFIGEILIQIYVLGKHGLDLPLLTNYWGNTIFVAIILKFMYYPRRGVNV